MEGGSRPGAHRDGGPPVSGMRFSAGAERFIKMPNVTAHQGAILGPYQVYRRGHAVLLRDGTETKRPRPDFQEEERREWGPEPGAGGRAPHARTSAQKLF